MIPQDEFLRVADALADRFIMLAKFDTSSEFTFEVCVGDMIPPQVSIVRTEWEMQLETDKEPALRDLIINWPFEKDGYANPMVDLEQLPVNVTWERNGSVIAFVKYTLTLRGQYFKP